MKLKNKNNMETIEKKINELQKQLDELKKVHEESQKAKVDFSILNDEDWFYVESEENIGIIRGVVHNKRNNCIEYEEVYTFENNMYRADGVFVYYYRNIRLLRKATPEDLAPMFEKYPKLAPPTVGDWGVFYDNRIKLNRAEAVEFMGVLGGIRDDGRYSIESHSGAWDNFYKIDPDKPLRAQIDKFIEQQTKR